MSQPPMPPTQAAVPDICDLIVNYIPTPSNDAEYAIFSQHGELVSARTDHTQGYGFANFKFKNVANAMMGKWLKLTPDRGFRCASELVELKQSSHIQCQACIAGMARCVTCQAAITGTVLPRRLVSMAATVIVKCSDCGSQMSRLDTTTHKCVLPVVDACCVLLLYFLVFRPPAAPLHPSVDLPSQVLPPKAVHRDPEPAPQEENPPTMASKPTAATVEPRVDPPAVVPSPQMPAKKALPTAKMRCEHSATLPPPAASAQLPVTNPTTRTDRMPPQRVPDAATRGTPEAPLQSKKKAPHQQQHLDQQGAASAAFPSAPLSSLTKFHQSNRSASEASPADLLAPTERKGPSLYPQDSALKSKAKEADSVSEDTLKRAVELAFSAAAKRAATEAEALSERYALAAVARADRARIEDDRARIDRARIEEDRAASPWPRDLSAPRHLRIPRFDETPTIYELLRPSPVCPSTAFQTLGWYVYEFKGFPLGLSRVLLLDFLDAYGLTEASGLCCVWGDEWKRITLASTRQRLGKTYDRATDHGTWLLAFLRPLTALQLDPTAAGPVTSGNQPFTFERENSQMVWQLQAMGLQITPR